MNTFKRAYVYAAAFVSLQAIMWGIIGILRNMLDGGGLDRLGLAWQLAVLIIGTPIFAGHWVWANRLTTADTTERRLVPRHIYLLAVMGTTLGPFIYHAYRFLSALIDSVQTPEQSWSAIILRESIPAMIITAVVWAVHYRWWHMAQQSGKQSPTTAVVRRLYQWTFTFTGLILVLSGVNRILARLFAWISDDLNGTAPLIDSAAQLIVGLPVLAIFWRWNQQLLAQNTADERNSLLRKLYLYGVLLLSLLLVVGDSTALTAQLLQRVLGIDPSGDLSDLGAFFIVSLGAWAAHQVILKRDEALASTAGKQITIRQIYRYLSAGVGFLAFLGGVSGLISIVMYALSGDNSYSPSEIAWFVAFTTVGLPLWLWFWRRVQQAAATAERAEYDSLVRRTYLYIFIFFAVLTILSAGVYIVYTLTAWGMGLDVGRRPFLDMAHAVAYGLMALFVWLYHTRVAGMDGNRWEMARKSRLTDLKVLLLEMDGRDLMATIAAELRGNLPGIHVDSLAPTAEITADEWFPMINNADVIIGSWTAVTPLSTWPEPMVQALMQTSAHKLMLPVPQDGWTWAGTAAWKPDDVASETAERVAHLATDGRALPERRWGVWATIGAVALGLFVLLNIIICIALTISYYGF